MGDNRIDFGKIATNALSTLVAAMFIGAAAIVWNGATTVGDKVLASEKRITAAISILSEEIAINADEIFELKEMLAELGYEINRPYSMDSNGNDEVVEDSTFYPPVNNRRDMKQSSIEEQIEQKYSKSLKK